MRFIVGLFGIVCGSVVVAIVARYGYKTASSDIDGIITGTLFGIIAAGALGGQAVAVRVWRQSAIWSLIIGAIAMLALLVNLTNSLGFIAGRGDATEAERIQQREQLRSERATLDRTIRERERMPVFTPATASTVDAARAAVSSTVAIRTAECEGRNARGSRCRAREADESKARETLVSIETNLALTEKAASLDAKIESLRARVDAAKPIAQDNPQAAALGLLFTLPVSTAATYQQLSVAVIVELLIVGALVAFELMGAEKRSRVVVETMPEVREPGAARKLAATPPPEASLAPPTSPETGSIEKIGEFMIERAAPTAGKSVSLTDAYIAYTAWCAEKGTSVVAREAFNNWFRTTGKKAGLDVKRRGKEWVCDGVVFTS